MIKVVIDTNIIVSTAKSLKGESSKIMNLVTNGEIKMHYSSDILAEYEEVLSREEIGITSEVQKEILEGIEERGIKIVPKISTIPMPDEDDRIFYDAAKEADATVVTYNIKDFPKTPEKPYIVTPGDYLSEWNRLEQLKQQSGFYETSISDPPKVQISVDIPPHQNAKTIEAQLTPIREQYSIRNLEVIRLENVAKDMKKDLAEIHEIDAQITDIRKNPKQYRNARKELNNLESSRLNRHEFFIREYNVQPFSAPKAIKDMREKAMVEKQAIQPLKERINALHTLQQQREAEKRMFLDEAQTMEKNYGFSIST